ncbi:XkdX family protein [Lactobacillus iners]|nr:XkdX family protein [Lactobacillus iners]MDK8133959.1 XkdX family protein [Lactobacillus iners]
MTIQQMFKELLRLQLLIGSMSSQEVRQFVPTGAITAQDYKDLTGVDYVQ